MTEVNERDFVASKQGEALRLLRDGDVDAAFDCYDKLRLNEDADTLADPELLADFFELTDHIDGLTERQRATAAVFKSTWAKAYDDAKNALKAENEDCEPVEAPIADSANLDWRYSPAGDLVGKPAHVTLKSFGFEKYGVISGELGLDEATGDMVIYPDEADGFPSGAYFPVGKVNERGYLKKYGLVQTLEVWDHEPEGFHLALDVSPVPEDKIMVGEKYDGVVSSEDPDLPAFDSVDTGYEPDGAGLATSVKAGDVDGPGLADLLRRHEYFDSLPLNQPDHEPLTDDEITGVMQTLAVDPEVQRGLEELEAKAAALHEKMSAGSGETAGSDATVDDATGGIAGNGDKPADDDGGGHSATGGLVEPSTRPIGWLASSETPDGSVDCTQAGLIASAAGLPLVVIDAAGCVREWSPRKVSGRSSSLAAIQSWELDLLSGHAVLAVTGLTAGRSDGDQLAARRLLRNGVITWEDGRSVSVPTSVMTFALVKPGELEAVKTAVESVEKQAE